jgi:polyhydroxybutyrate depolymerase
MAPNGGVSPSGGVSFGGTSLGGSSPGGHAMGGAGGTAGSAGTQGRAGDSSGAGGATSLPCPSGGWGPGDHRITLTHDGIEREYEVHVPPGYTGTTRVPLVMTIHGAHNTISMVKGWSQMNPVADANGFIVVYPQAVDCWNTGFMLCEAADDDVGFLTTVVADIQSHACIDPKRVYATGISNGAMMAQYLGCREAGVFAAIGGIAGPNGGGCNPSRPLSVVYMHGTEDATVGYSSARPTVTGWATRNGCSSTPAVTYDMGSTRCETYSGCRENGEVVFCTHTGMGHCWPEDSRCGPGGGPDFAITDFEASPFMWEFFERHPLP